MELSGVENWKISSKKHSHIKKQAMAQKFLHLLRSHKYVLFFHYNGAADRKVLQQWREKLQPLRSCKTFHLPSKIAFYTETPFTTYRLFDKTDKLTDVVHAQLGGKKFFSGGALLVTCSSPLQMAILLEKCSSSTFLCIGGMHEHSFLNHLDIQRWVSLHNKNVHPHLGLLTPLLQGQRIILPFLMQQQQLLSLQFLAQRLIFYLTLLKEKK